jgi:hypothetical protein
MAGASIHLVRDLLDKRLVDREGRPIGRVDGVVIEVGHRKPPRVTAMELGALTLARRMPRWLRGPAIAIAQLLRPLTGPPIRIGLERFLDVGVDIELDVSADDPDVQQFERWLRRHVIERIPGGGE